MEKNNDIINQALGLVPTVKAEVVEAPSNSMSAKRAQTIANRINGVGRPLKFPSVELLQIAIDDYFAKCDAHTKEVVAKNGEVVKVSAPLPYTISGMAVHLDTDRGTLMNYEEKDQYSDTIKRAKQRCLADSEMRLHTNFTAGVIFSMKNNFGWKDQIDVNTNQNHTIEVKPPKGMFNEDD